MSSTRSGDVRLSAINARVIEGFQAKRRVEGASNPTVNMDVGALRQVLKRFKQWRRLEDDVMMLTESGGEPIGQRAANASSRSVGVTPSKQQPCNVPIFVDDRRGR